MAERSVSVTDPPSAATAGEAAEPAGRHPNFGEALRFWVKLGFINFGGPAGQIAIMHRELVDRKRWVGETQFLRALNFCMILPGPEAQQLATYIGWRLHGVLGGVVAGTWFVLPSILVLLVLSWLAAAHAEIPWVAGLLYGLQPVVLAIVLEAVLRIGKRALKHPVLYAFAVAAFLALAVLRVPFPIVVAAAALAGALLQRWQPAAFQPQGHGGGSGEHAHDEPEAVKERLPDAGWGRALRVIGVFLVLWLIPVGLLWAWRGAGDTVVQQALFFTQAAFVTFGGAYAVLSYVGDVAVNQFSWLTGEQMVQGLGLAESTPGPLIMVLQYVGFMGAWNHPGDFPRLPNAVLGALVTTYVTFLPCFLFIFLGAPYIERLSRNRRLQAALTGVTAAVVGVIANLALFFGTKVLFPQGGVDWFAVAGSVAAFVALQRFHTPVYWLVLAGAILGIARKLLVP